jgi:hypothetical protein
VMATPLISSAKVLASPPPHVRRVGKGADWTSPVMHGLAHLCPHVAPANPPNAPPCSRVGKIAHPILPAAILRPAILPTLRRFARIAPMTATLDAITLEVIRNALPAVATTERARNAIRSNLGNAKQGAKE